MTFKCRMQFDESVSSNVVACLTSSCFHETFCIYCSVLKDNDELHFYLKRKMIKIIWLITSQQLKYIEQRFKYEKSYRKNNMRSII